MTMIEDAATLTGDTMAVTVPASRTRWPRQCSMSQGLAPISSVEVVVAPRAGAIVEVAQSLAEETNTDIAFDYDPRLRKR